MCVYNEQENILLRAANDARTAAEQPGDAEEDAQAREDRLAREAYEAAKAAVLAALADGRTPTGAQYLERDVYLHKLSDRDLRQECVCPLLCRPRPVVVCVHTHTRMHAPCHPTHACSDVFYMYMHMNMHVHMLLCMCMYTRLHQLRDRARAPAHSTQPITTRVACGTHRYVDYSSMYLADDTGAATRGMAEMTLIKLGELVDQPRARREKMVERQAEEARQARQLRQKELERSAEERTERTRQAGMNEASYAECRAHWEQLTMAVMGGGHGLREEARVLAKRVAQRVELRLVTMPRDDVRRLPPGAFVAMGTSGLAPTELRAVLHALLAAAPPGAAAQRFLAMLQERVTKLDDYEPSGIEFYDSQHVDAPLGMASGRGTAGSYKPRPPQNVQPKSPSSSAGKESAASVVASVVTAVAASSSSGRAPAPPPPVMSSGAAPPLPPPPPPPPPAPPPYEGSVARASSWASSSSGGGDSPKDGGGARSAMLDELVKRASRRSRAAEARWLAKEEARENEED